MFKPAAMLSWLLPCCATDASDPGTLKALLDPANIGVLSAACCDTTAKTKDDGLQANLREALQAEADPRAVVFDTITAAQRHMRTLQAGADASQAKLIGSVVALFQANGLSIFPLLIIDGRVAYYGGIPTIEMIRDKLRARAAARVLTTSGT